VNWIFRELQALLELKTANPRNDARHLTFCDLVLRRLGYSSIPGSRSEVVLEVCLRWRPCSFRRPHRDSLRIHVTRPFHIPMTLHQPRRQICWRYIRSRVPVIRRYPRSEISGCNSATRKSSDRRDSEARATLRTRREAGQSSCLFLFQFVADAVGLAIHSGKKVVRHISRGQRQYHGFDDWLDPVYGK